MFTCYWVSPWISVTNPRSGTPLFTLRSANWNERLGVVPAERVAVVAGGVGSGEALRPVTLKRVLQDETGLCCGKWGMKNEDTKMSSNYIYNCM